MKQKNVEKRALRAYVLADGVLSSGGDIPATWFQYEIDASGQERATPASDRDAIARACASIDTAGLQPVVIVPNAQSEALFCVQYATENGPEVEYALRDTQPINLLDILSRPDDQAIDAWAALCEDRPTRLTRAWPQSVDTLRAFGEEWLEWAALSGHERAPANPEVPRPMRADEFEPRGTSPEGGDFVHQTAPFAVLHVDLARRQLIPQGALAGVPEGLHFDDFAARLQNTGGTAATNQPAPRSATILTFRLRPAQGVPEEAAPDLWAEAAADDLSAPRELVNEWLDEHQLRIVASITSDGLTIDLLGDDPELVGRRFRCTYADEDPQGEVPQVEITLERNFLDPERIEGQGVLPPRPGLDRLTLEEITG